MSEIFYSVQGEGRFIGRPAAFLRLSGCNLRCPWCDSKYTWSESIDIPVTNVKNIIGNFNHLVITGGEPLLQWKEVNELLSLLGPGLVEIETNGTINPEPQPQRHIFWNVSPKLSNSGNVKPLSEYFLDAEVDAIFKFVVDKERDFEEINEFVDKHNIYEGYVYLMPQSTSPEEHNSKLPFIIGFAKKMGYNVTPRLQILAYGLRRGV